MLLTNVFLWILKTISFLIGSSQPKTSSYNDSARKCFPHMHHFTFICVEFPQLF